MQMYPYQENSSEILLNVLGYNVCHARYKKPLKKLALKSVQENSKYFVTRTTPKRDQFRRIHRNKVVTKTYRSEYVRV